MLAVDVRGMRDRSHAAFGATGPADWIALKFQLVEHGVVEEVPGGFRLNRDHLAADAIVSLASLHGALVERLRHWATGQTT